MSAGTLERHGGFSPGGRALPGDCNHDAVLDLSDFDLFANCMKSPDLAVSFDCRCANVDEHDDVDLTDFTAQQNGYAAS
jgi:hypothetical protein